MTKQELVEYHAREGTKSTMMGSGIYNIIYNDPSLHAKWLRSRGHYEKAAMVERKAAKQWT